MASALLNISLAMWVGASRVSGELVVVEDTTGAPHDPSQNLAGVDLALCAFAARGLYTVEADAYDAVVTFTSHPMTGPSYALTGATPSGYQVRQPATGVGFGGWLIRQPPSAYNSPATLKHCVYMGPLRQWPLNPDDSFMLPGPFGVGTMNSGTTGIEVLGHEFGHYWLMFAGHDQGDGRGVQALFRGDPRDPDMADRPPVSAANLHYSHYADARSVMYGNFITSLGGGMFKMEGGDRKYGPLDQYLMGLRAASETPPLMAIDDGSGRGLIAPPLPKGQSQVVSGTAVNISVNDVIRAIGPRVPAYPNTQKCFRIAFVLVTQPGHAATVDEIALVDGYRRRWEQWFPWATDGRASTDTRLAPSDPCPTKAPPDPLETAVNSEPLPPEPAAIDVAMPDAPMAPVVVPPPDEETHKLRPGCGCAAGFDGSALLFVLVLWARRRASPSRSAGARHLSGRAERAEDL